MSKSVEVVIDTREDTDYRTTFEEHDQVSSVDVKQMETSDFRVSPVGGESNVLFERKTPGDLVASMKNRRLEKQLQSMYEEEKSSRVYLVVEGNLSDFEYMPYTEMTQNSVHGFIGSVSARWQCTPLFCSDKIKLTDMVVRVSRKCFEDTTRVVRKPSSSPRKANAGFFDKALLQLEGIGRKNKDRIKEEFANLPELIDADVEDLKEVEGIGTKRAESILKQLREGQKSKIAQEALMEEKEI